MEPEGVHLERLAHRDAAERVPDACEKQREVVRVVHRLSREVDTDVRDCLALERAQQLRAQAVARSGNGRSSRRRPVPSAAAGGGQWMFEHWRRRLA